MPQLHVAEADPATVWRASISEVLRNGNIPELPPPPPLPLEDLYEPTDLPLALIGSEVRGEIESQANYIEELERLLNDSARATSSKEHPRVGATEQVPPAKVGPSEALDLRRENRMLRAKVFAQQQQLREAHNREHWPIPERQRLPHTPHLRPLMDHLWPLRCAGCRRSEEVNAQWRYQHGLLRKRERELWEQLQHALKRAERFEESERQGTRLRESLKERRYVHDVHAQSLKGIGSAALLFRIQPVPPPPLLHLDSHLVLASVRSWCAADNVVPSWR